jgi:uroporphyrinogen decarboxylase
MDTNDNPLATEPVTHKQRVQTALAHEQPDRVPLEMSFTPEFAGRLGADLFGKSGSTHNPHGGGNDYTLERALDLDVLLTSVGWANSYYAGDTYNPGADHYTDEWGIDWKNIPYETPFGRGHYTEFCNPPLAEEDAIASYRAPDPTRPELYTAVEEAVREFGKEYWIVGSCQTTIWETAVALRGFETILMDLLAEPELVEAVLDIPQNYHMEVCRRLVRLGVDMVWLGDDLGAQDAMIMAPDQWRAVLKPRMAAMIAEMKTINPDVKIAYHTDGFVEPVVGDLIEIGIDVLHPVQPQSMDPAALKKKFGDRLCFMGGIDVQSTLPFGTPEEVRQEVRQRIATVGKSGGLILAPTHHVQLDTPVENLLAMVEEAKNFAGTP